MYDLEIYIFLPFLELDSIEISIRRAPSMYLRQFFNRNPGNEILQTWPLFQTKKKGGKKAEGSRGCDLKRWKQQENWTEKKKKKSFSRCLRGLQWQGVQWTSHWLP